MVFLYYLKDNKMAKIDVEALVQFFNVLPTVSSMYVPMYVYVQVLYM